MILNICCNTAVSCDDAGEITVMRIPHSCLYSNVSCTSNDHNSPYAISP